MTAYAGKREATVTWPWARPETQPRARWAARPRGQDRPCLSGPSLISPFGLNVRV